MDLPPRRVVDSPLADCSDGSFGGIAVKAQHLRQIDHISGAATLDGRGGTTAEEQLAAPRCPHDGVGVRDQAAPRLGGGGAGRVCACARAYALRVLVSVSCVVSSMQWEHF